MEQQMPRVHHFYVSMAKYLFHHPLYGIVSVQDPITLKEAAGYELTPLLLYGVTVVGLPVRWLTFPPVEQPKAFQEVLLKAWCHGQGLRGRPDILRVSRHLSMACPELVLTLAKLGVRMEVAAAKDKSLPASLRSAQDASKWLLRRYKANVVSLTEAVQCFCLCAQDDHDFRSRDADRYVGRREVKAQLQ